MVCSNKRSICVLSVFIGHSKTNRTSVRTESVELSHGVFCWALRFLDLELRVWPTKRSLDTNIHYGLVGVPTCYWS